MKNDVFLRNAEQATLEKLLGLASRIMGAQEGVRDCLDSYTSIKPSEPFLQEFLKTNAVVVRLQCAVDDVVRNHEVLCPCGCGTVYKFRELTIRIFVGKGESFFIMCPKSKEKNGNLVFGPLLGSFFNILDFAHIPMEKVFAKTYSD